VGLMVVVFAACGRYGFEVHGGASDSGASDSGASGSGTSDDAQRDGATASPVSWVKTFVAQFNSAATLTDTFDGAAAAGDAVVWQAFCGNGVEPSAVTVAAPGWTFVQIGSITGSTTSGYWGTSFGAIAPDAASTKVTVTWTAATACANVIELGDEFAGVDTSSASSAFDTHAELLSDGNCVTSLTTGAANEAVWAACTVNTVTSCGSGYTKSADDGHGDWSEYKLTTDPAHTTEGVMFETATGTDGYLVTAVALRPD
jgi:hypothetical protein